MSGQLLPCPFCGAEPRFSPVSVDGNSQVWCEACNVCVEHSDADLVWNRRTHPAQQDGIAIVKAALEAAAKKIETLGYVSREYEKKCSFDKGAADIRALDPVAILDSVKEGK